MAYKYLELVPNSSMTRERSPTTVGQGAASAGQIVGLNDAGVVDITMIPPEVIGGSGGSTTVPFFQTIPSNAWAINHNLGRFPSVTIVDSAGTQMYGAVEYIDDNNILISFSSALAGTAYLN